MKNIGYQLNVGNDKPMVVVTTGRPIALYGIGEKTKLLLENLPEYHFVALIDQNSTGYIIHGKPVMTIEDLKGKIKNIIIVCNYSSVNIIYKRISHYESQYGISIYHMNGKMNLRIKKKGIFPRKKDFFFNNGKKQKK